MGQFEAALRLTLELIKHHTILNHQVGDKFQRDIALQFFIAREPDNSHSASPEHLDQRVAAKDSLSAGELTRRRACDAACAFVSHRDRVYIIKMGRKFKAGGEAPSTPLRICEGSQELAPPPQCASHHVKKCSDETSVALTHGAVILPNAQPARPSLPSNSHRATRDFHSHRGSRKRARNAAAANC